MFFGPTKSTICPIYKSNISDVCIGLIIVQISSKNRGHKIVFIQTACDAPFGKKRYCPTYFARVFWSDLEYILSDI